MRKLANVFLLFFVVAVTTTACGGDPNRELTLALGTYAGAVAAINEGYENGTISDEVLVKKIDPAKQAAQSALAVAQSADQGDDFAELVSKAVATAVVLWNTVQEYRVNE